MADFSTENNKDVDRNWTEKRERDKERDEEGVPEDESSSDVAPSATKRFFIFFYRLEKGNLHKKIWTVQKW